MNVQKLPRIVRFIDTLDCPDAACPHCGAHGRFILRFRVEDGRELGAMRGCVKLFPVSRIAIEELRLRTKLTEYQKKGWRGLNQADTCALQAIEAYYEQGGNERCVLAIVDSAKNANRNRYGASKRNHGQSIRRLRKL